MSAGSYDFIDQAVETLKQGGHVFFLATLDRINAEEHRFSLRSAVYTKQDILSIRGLINKELDGYLKRLVEDME